MIFRILSWLLLAVLGLPALYLCFFALASRLPVRGKVDGCGSRKRRFVVLVPSYKCDSCILDSAVSALNQDYPADLYRVVVISDSMREDTVEALRLAGVEVLVVNFEKSTKAKSLQAAVDSLGPDAADTVVILDADNVVRPDFLSSLDDALVSGVTAVQAHRCAKNKDTGVAVIDAASEEINNSIFRKGHCAVGLSSALIGSGMALPYDWFSSRVHSLATSGEDKELELALLHDGVYVQYAEDIPVLDEKTATVANYSRQRRRWLASPTHLISSALPLLPTARFKVGYADKLFQWMLPPRLLIMAMLPVLALVVTLLGGPGIFWWWTAVALLVLSLLLGLPHSMYDKDLLKSLSRMPQLAAVTLVNLFRIRGTKDNFIHTDHK